MTGAPPKKRLKNRDVSHDVYQLKIINWSLAIAVAGAVIGTLLANATGGNGLLFAVVGFFGGGLGMYFGVNAVVGRSADVMQQIYNPTGNSTPPKREYSYAESLVARERYDEAIAAYELHCLEYADDPEPYFRLARLYVQLQRFEDAVQWFRRVRADAKLSSGQELVALQSIIELYLNKLHTPRKAIPELVRLSQRFPSTAAGEAAVRDLAMMRELMAKEHEQMSSFTEEFLSRVSREPAGRAAEDALDAVERKEVSDELRAQGGDVAKTAEHLALPMEDVAEEAARLARGGGDAPGSQG